MRNTWIKIGCFLTGTNYDIVNSCSELSKKRVIKYTSALLIVALIWTFVGYLFTQRYLRGEWYACLAASVIMVFLVIQIERQVILSGKDQRLLQAFRVVIAFLMAAIGTVIIDQVMFQDDIDKRKLKLREAEIQEIIPTKAQELRRQIHEMDSTILSKENERKSITDDVLANPFYTVIEQDIKYDSARRRTVNITKRKEPNPKASLIAPMDKNIIALREEKTKKDNLLLGLRTQIEKDLEGKVGFLDELEVMFLLLTESGVSLVAWSIWFLFLLGLELFILASKVGEKELDYDKRMEQQMQLHYRRMELMNQQAVPD